MSSPSRTQFQTQLLFNLERSKLRTLVAEFYTFNEEVMREFLGKTLNKTVRPPPRTTPA